MSSFPQPHAELFVLGPQRRSRISSSLDKVIDQRIASLREITAERGGTERTFQDTIIDQLVERLRGARTMGWTWEEATRVRRRQWALLRMYTLYLGAPNTEKWLHPFDEAAARDILGEESRPWHSSRRREVTRFFFLKYDQIQCLRFISEMLQKAWTTETVKFPDEATQAWSTHARILFHENGPEMVASQLRHGEGLTALCHRFYIPEDGGFRDCLYEAVILRKLRLLSLNENNEELFDQCEVEKSRIMRDGRTIGYRAVEILVKRSIDEGGGEIGENWSRRLVALSGDPRTVDLAARQTWWGWATEEERRVAVRGLTRLNLQEFIRLLDESLASSGKRHQFKRRKDFLLNLFENHIILEASIVIHDNLYDGLDRRTRESLRPSRVRSGTQQASFICLKCINDIYLIEGTFNFALRGFIGRDQFPIQGFWENDSQSYVDRQFRVPAYECDIVQRHHTGTWELDAIHLIRNAAYVDWNRSLQY